MPAGQRLFGILHSRDSASPPEIRLRFELPPIASLPLLHFLLTRVRGSNRASATSGSVGNVHGLFHTVYLELKMSCLLFLLSTTCLYARFVFMDSSSNGRTRIR